MPRIDDYKKALELAKKELEDKNPKRIADQSGAEFEPGRQGDSFLTLVFLGRKVVMSWQDKVFALRDSGEEIPIQQQVLLLHYLNGAKGSKPGNEWISYQDVPDGRFYIDAFQRRAKIPLVKKFGHRPRDLIRLAEKAYGGRAMDHGDVSVLIQALPIIPVVLLLWEGDEEFPPEGNILFDRSISEILSAEDIAWLAGMTVYPLIGMAGEEKTG